MPISLRPSISPNPSLTTDRRNTLTLHMHTNKGKFTVAMSVGYRTLSPRKYPITTDATFAEHWPAVHAQQPQPRLQPQAQQQQPQSAGPPYVFDLNATYPDPNVQAWANYYAQGGTDSAGAVYFVSVPGVKDTLSPPDQTPQSHQSSLDPYQAQAQQPTAHQEAMHQSPTSQHATYMNPNPQQSQYPTQPYYQEPASAPQVSPTSATIGISLLQRTSSATAGVPAPYSYHSPTHQPQLSPTGQVDMVDRGLRGMGMRCWRAIAIGRLQQMATLSIHRRGQGMGVHHWESTHKVLGRVVATSEEKMDAGM
ncbi:hypothetical protein EDB19DRAFT_1907179 [Suillus lakei]|nr:hypothetical protein EDB19DRAFT_1907179 [Suillus lakei]